MAPRVRDSASPPRVPAYAFRCGSHLITEGDTRSEVLAKCGEPTEIEVVAQYFRRPLVWIRGRPYNVGQKRRRNSRRNLDLQPRPQQAHAQVRFEDGKVVEIETLGYGYHEHPNPAQRPADTANPRGRSHRPASAPD